MTLTDFEEKENYYSVKKKKKQKANQIHHVINITVLWSYMYNRENWPENCLLGSHDTYYRCICLCSATWSMNLPPIEQLYKQQVLWSIMEAHKRRLTEVKMED